jgi:hypothetical protein
MDRLVQLDVVLMAKIIGLPTFDTHIEDYLENKAHEKEIVELVKAQFGTSRRNRGIVLKEINGNAKRFSNKIMACNLLRKCRKEEAPVGFIAVVTQCAKGVMFSWAPYQLNQFLIDCRDVQDNGIEFHYSWSSFL